MTNTNDIERLFRSNYSVMYALAFRIIHDRDLANDIVHDIFASLLSVGSGNIDTSYLLKAVRNNCLKHIRDLSIRERLNGLYALEQDNPGDEEWPDEEDIAKMNSIVDNMLSDQCRRVVRLRFAAKMGYREISEELGISETAVYKHLRHALNVLRQNF